MLEISESKISRMQAAQLENYKKDLFRYFRKHFPEETRNLDDQSLRDIIHKHVDGGLKRGIETSEAMSRYVGIGVLVNPDFADQKEVVELFNYTGFDPDYKVHILSDALIKELKSE